MKMYLYDFCSGILPPSAAPVLALSLPSFLGGKGVDEQWGIPFEQARLCVAGGVGGSGV